MSNWIFQLSWETGFLLGSNGLMCLILYHEKYHFLLELLSIVKNEIRHILFCQHLQVSFGLLRLEGRFYTSRPSLPYNTCRFWLHFGWRKSALQVKKVHYKSNECMTHKTSASNSASKAQQVHHKSNMTYSKKKFNMHFRREWNKVVFACFEPLYTLKNKCIRLYSKIAMLYAVIFGLRLFFIQVCPGLVMRDIWHVTVA